MPLSRKSGGLRPVVVGNLMRRLASKTVAFALARKAANLFQLLQFSMGVRGGCEAVVHANREVIENEDESPQRKWSLQVDLENGYNLTNRTKMMEEARRNFLELSRSV